MASVARCARGSAWGVVRGVVATGLLLGALAPSSASAAAKCSFVMRKVDECLQTWSKSAGHSYVGIADLYYCEDMTQNPWNWYEWRTSVTGLNNASDGEEYRSFYPRRHTGKVPANDTCSTIGQFLSIEAAELAEKRIRDYADSWSGGDFLLQTVLPGATRPCKRVVKEARTLVKMNVDTCIAEWFNPKVDRTAPGFTSFADHARFWQANGDEATACLAGVKRRCKDSKDAVERARYCAGDLTLAAAEAAEPTYAALYVEEAFESDALACAEDDAADLAFYDWYDEHAEALMAAAWADDELGVGGAWSALGDAALLDAVLASWDGDAEELLTDAAFALGATEEEWAALWDEDPADDVDEATCDCEESDLVAIGPVYEEEIAAEEEPVIAEECALEEATLEWSATDASATLWLE